MDIKQEDHLSDSQNETHLFFKDVTNSDVLNNDYDTTIKTEVKSENVLPDFTSQNERDDIKYHSDHEVYNKVEIKEELCLGTETASLCGIEDVDLLPVKSSRLYTVAVFGDSDKSLLRASEEPAFCKEQYHSVYETQKSDVAEIQTVEHIPLEQSGKCSDGHDRALYLKQNNFIHRDKSLKCKICDKEFTLLSNLKRHSLIHEGKKPHKCEICGKRFTVLSSLKRHNLIHEHKKPHKCQICQKEFTELSNLKQHNFVHEGNKPFKCEVCGKRFIYLTHLKSHCLIHEGTKPHKCQFCDKGFTVLSNLKKHNLTHEGKKRHKCQICSKEFTMLSSMRRHYLIHNDERPFKCIICKKGFTQMSHLKTHNLIHMDVKPHHCQICEKRFNNLSNFKRHSQRHNTLCS